MLRGAEGLLNRGRVENIVMEYSPGGAGLRRRTRACAYVRLRTCARLRRAGSKDASPSWAASLLAAPPRYAAAATRAW